MPKGVEVPMVKNWKSGWPLVRKFNNWKMQQLRIEAFLLIIIVNLHLGNFCPIPTVVFFKYYGVLF